MPTKIEWCDETINPAVGCSKCSPGCDNCYAEKMAFRISRMPHTAEKYARVVDEAGRWTGNISRLDLSVFDKLPNKPRSVFLGSMTDLFHPTALVNFSQIWDKITENRRHTFLILTKRTQNMRSSLSPYFGKIPENLWIGTTVCNQEEANANIPILKQIPTTRSFVSIEPMLGPIDISRACLPHIMPPKCVIVGGETGPRARPMHPDWVRSIRNQCAAAGVPFFFKGWGEYLLVDDLHQSLDYADYRNGFISYDGFYTEDEEPRSSFSDQEFVARVGKKIAGRLLDGVEHNERPW